MLTYLMMKMILTVVEHHDDIGEVTRTKMMLTGEKARQEDGGGAKASGRNIIINTPASLSIIVASLENIKFHNSYIEQVMPE